LLRERTDTETKDSEPVAHELSNILS
jgi:hypothetical protein